MEAEERREAVEIGNLSEELKVGLQSIDCQYQTLEQSIISQAAETNNNINSMTRAIMKDLDMVCTRMTEKNESRVKRFYDSTRNFKKWLGEEQAYLRGEKTVKRLK